MISDGLNMFTKVRHPVLFYVGWRISFIRIQWNLCINDHASVTRVTNHNVGCSRFPSVFVKDCWTKYSRSFTSPDFSRILSRIISPQLPRVLDCPFNACVRLLASWLICWFNSASFFIWFRVRSVLLDSIWYASFHLFLKIDYLLSQRFQDLFKPGSVLFPWISGSFPQGSHWPGSWKRPAVSLRMLQ